MFCASCGTQLDATDRFCSNCGAARKDAPAATGAAPPVYAAVDPGPISYGPPPADLDDELPEVAPRFNVRKLVVGGIAGAVFWGAIILLIAKSDGCSSTEGALTAQGDPLGDFTFTPTQCRSGQHEQFFGVFLLGDDGNAGGVKIVVDPRSGEFVQIEVPGSCSGPDNGNCTVVTVEPDMCKKFSAEIDRTSTTVNDIRLLDGHLQLACTFPEGGSVTADVTFESCD